MQKIAALLNIKDWPLFRPIPRELNLHVRKILLHELFWNVRLALMMLLMAMALYHYLISQEIALDRFMILIVVQMTLGAIVLAFYWLAENRITSVPLRLGIAGFQAFLVGGAFGLGFLLQVPGLKDPYRIATVYTMIVGVTGAASFTFTVSPMTFLAFCVPFVAPLFSWLWLASPAGAGKILALMVFPYFTSIFFLVLREYRRRVNLILAELRLKQEQERSESLLLNILPKSVASDLKAHGKTEPSEFQQVTVMFTDFVGFTRIGEMLTPRELVDELDKCFSYFDQVTEKYRLEKLKTIGDSFMCAGGLPTPNRTHAIDCCLAALEIQAFMNQMRDIKTQQGFDYWELRLGMNTGPLVAGVVGHKKFAYDVWGDTVNTASRLESSGVPGKINIALTTYELVKDFFVCEHRGQVSAKNKGEIDMYFLQGIRPEYSMNGEARVPNENFRKKYKDIIRNRL